MVVEAVQCRRGNSLDRSHSAHATAMAPRRPGVSGARYTQRARLVLAGATRGRTPRAVAESTLFEQRMVVPRRAHADHPVAGASHALAARPARTGRRHARAWGATPLRGLGDARHSLWPSPPYLSVSRTLRSRLPELGDDEPAVVGRAVLGVPRVRVCVHLFCGSARASGATSTALGAARRSAVRRAADAAQSALPLQQPQCARRAGARSEDA